jgi:hypothetical protein
MDNLEEQIERGRTGIAAGSLKLITGEVGRKVLPNRLDP